VARTLVLPCSEPSSGIRIDLIFSLSPYERQAIARARTVDVGGAPVRYAAVEDLVIHKLVAGRPRDLEDVRSVLRKQPSLDQAYVRRWLSEFGPQESAKLLASFEEVSRPEPS
jgi:predicted nucleotidyltransferase